MPHLESPTGLAWPGNAAEVPKQVFQRDDIYAEEMARIFGGPEWHLIAHRAEVPNPGDFKTARRPPNALEDVPDHNLRQMAANVAALEANYPGRAVRAALLYTQTPQLIELPPATLAAYKTRFADPQESFALPPVE